MGCDIHAYTEQQLRDGSWKALRDSMPNRYFSADEPESAWNSPVEIPQEELGRSYGLFAILAGVRNGSGFAGTDLGDPTVPMAEPKGIPEDASPEYRSACEGWGDDGHSHSHFTLGEIYSHDWERPATNRAQVRKNREWKKPAVFTEYDRGRGIVDDSTFATALEELFQGYGNQVYDWKAWDFESCGWSSEGAAGGWRGIEWTTSHKDQVGSKFFELIFDLATEAHKRGLTPDQVRLVFFFDN